MNPEKLAMSDTTDGLPPRPGFENAGAPAPINPRTGQHEAYWVLSIDERAKGFVRPVRVAYKHVGRPGPTYPLEDVTDEDRARFGVDYVKFERYPESELPVTGRFWTQADFDQIDRGCGSVTTMRRDIAETYARDPNYYGSTMCVACNKHLPVGEFVWMDNGVATTERVGM